MSEFKPRKELPPAVTRGRGLISAWPDRLAVCRTDPGEWYCVAEYKMHKTAYVTSAALKKKYPEYQFCGRVKEEGRRKVGCVYARYVGEIKAG